MLIHEKNSDYLKSEVFQMTLRHFEILQAIEQTGSFTKAAEKLYLTQSAVSHAVKEMEQQTHTVLFNRFAKKVTLTECGKRLLQKVAPILRECAAIEKSLPLLEYQAPIRIVSGITASIFYLPQVLKEFTQKFHSIRVYTQVIPAAAAMERLRNSEADFAIIEGAACRHEAFICQPFASYDLVFVGSPDFYRAEKPLTPAELCERPLLLREPGSAVRDTLDSALYLNGLQADPQMVSVNSSALLAAAEAGLGIAHLPKVLVSDAVRAGRLVCLPVEQLALSNPIFLVHHRQKVLTQPMQWLMRQFLDLYRV